MTVDLTEFIAVFEHGNGEMQNHGRAIRHMLRAINELQENQMSTQAQVDALTAELTQVASDLVASSAALQTEIDSLSAANPGVSLTALQAAADALDPAVKAIGALVPVAGARGPIGPAGAAGPPTPPLFAFSGDPTVPVDATIWAKASITEPSGQALYTLVAGVSQPADPAFTAYTGPTIPAV